MILQCDKKDLPYFLSRQLVLFLQLVLPVPFNDKMTCEQNQPALQELRRGKRIYKNIIDQTGPIILSLGILI